MTEPDAMSEFDQNEERDGVRLSWNVWPSNKQEAANAVIPVGCLYSPFKRSQAIPIVNYEPILCSGSCRTILNPFCDIDFNSKSWTCPFCYRRNQLPQHYSVITETNLPIELIPNITTLEYLLPRAVALPPVFLFVVDTALPAQDLEPLKDTLLMGLSLIPQNARIGLITFGATVHVHELAFEACPKAYVFNGTKDVTPQRVQQLLGFGKPTGQGGQGGHRSPDRFILPLSECEETLETILEDLQPEPQAIKPDMRRLRGTGAALSVAIGLLENSFSNSAARIMLFVGGPCTQGPGLVVGTSLKEFMRSHHDITQGNAKLVTKAKKFYKELASRAVKNGHGIDIFGCSLDQVGMLEMSPLVRDTGGFCVLADGFDTEMFQGSFKGMFERQEGEGLKMAFNAGFEVQTSKELKVCGAIGQCASMNRKGPCVSESPVGVGETSAWRICVGDPSSTLALYFEVVNPAATPLSRGQKGCIQFQTLYQNSEGQRILRVTTLTRNWADVNAGNGALSIGFDQEAAAVLMARFATYKAELMGQDNRDILRWLDRSLIRLCSNFSEKRKGDPSSFRLDPAFTLYPQFMFHLRRSDLLQVFNNSPDESCFKRMWSSRQTVSNCLMMIQPTLEAYMLNQPAFPVLLSSASISSDRVLVLDTFFHVVVWFGDKIADWRNQGYADLPDYAHLKALLEAPQEYVDMVKKERLPLPRFIQSDEGKSQARFLTARVDPTITHKSGFGSRGDEAIATEDVTLEVFMTHLTKLAVQP